MLNTIPANETELQQAEAFVQAILASTLSYDLKKPLKLRELTCRLLGFENGFQQLQAYWATQDDDPRVEHFINWLLQTLSKHLGKPEADIEQDLCREMDELVYDYCGTGPWVSDEINNQGLSKQVEAVYNQCSYRFTAIVNHLAENVYPEANMNLDQFSAWMVLHKGLQQGLLDVGTNTRDIDRSNPSTIIQPDAFANARGMAPQLKPLRSLSADVGFPNAVPKLRPVVEADDHCISAEPLETVNVVVIREGRVDSLTSYGNDPIGNQTAARTFLDALTAEAGDLDIDTLTVLDKGYAQVGDQMICLAHAE